MRITCKNPTRLLVPFTGMAIAAALLSTPVAGALASTGGSSAPTGAVAPNARVHKTAIATWFGPGFYGQRTACGQMLTPEVVGVANRTLPCGTLVKISYKGHTLTVPVLDRGPYAHGADWDLTAGAATALDITETVRIATKVVGVTANTPALGAPLFPASGSLAGGALAG
jgi:rare lipoprotein A (peptidoglycan hydrolase)